MIAFSFLVSCQALFANDPQSLPSITLKEAVIAALGENLNLEVQRYAPKIQKEAVDQQRSAFDPSVFSRASVGQSELEWEDIDGDPRQTTSDSRSYSAGVTKRIKTGAQVTASAAHSRSDGSSFNPELNQLVGGGLSERASLSLEISQPLLRDFGSTVNLAPVRRAESQERVASLRLRNDIFDLLQRTETAYWRLADTYARRDLRESNLELAAELLEESAERKRLGLATQLEVLQAEASLAQRREEIIRADQAIQEAADLLFSEMGALDNGLAIDARLSVDPLVESKMEIPDFDSVARNAFERNFDTAIQEEILDQLEQDRILARNEKKPEVDLSLSTSYDGLSPLSAKDAFDQAFDRRGEDWGLNLSFNLPWGRRAAKSNLRQTLYRIDQGEAQLAALKQDLLRSVRTAWRSFDISREQVDAARLVVALQEATFERERSRFEEGQSTLRNILEIQRDLDSAAVALLDAQLNAVEAEINLSRVEGTILRRYGLDWNSGRVASP